MIYSDEFRSRPNVVKSWPMARLKLSLFSFLIASRRPGKPYFSSSVMLRWLVPFLLVDAVSVPVELLGVECDVV